MTAKESGYETSMIIPLVLFAAFMIMQANFLILPFWATYIAEDLTLSNREISIFLAVFSVAVAVSNLFWSRLLDRFNRKTVLLFGGFFVAAVFIITSIASNLNTLITSRILMAVVMPLMGASILPFVVDIYAPKDRPRIMGYVMSAGYVVNLALIPLVVLVSDHYSWRYVGFGLSAFTVMVFVIAFFNLPKPDTPQPKQAGSKPKLNIFSVDNRATLSNLLRKFVQTAGIFTIFAVYPTWLNSSAHDVSYSSVTVASIIFVSGVLGFLGSTVSGRMNDMLNKMTNRVEPLLIVSIFCAGFCFLIPLLGKGLPFYQYISYAPMFFFQSIAVVLLMNSLITSVDATQRGYINAMSNIVFQAGIAVGSFVGFWVFEKISITTVSILAGLLIAVSALNLIPLSKPENEEG